MSLALMECFVPLRVGARASERARATCLPSGAAGAKMADRDGRERKKRKTCPSPRSEDGPQLHGGVRGGVVPLHADVIKRY